MGLLDYNTSDGRFLFMLPWQNHTLVGTTDSESPAQTLPGPPTDEVDWLLNECKTYLSPDLQVRRSDVLSAWQGWRPLAADPHAPPGAPVSRDHVISENTETGIIFIAGGKWSKFPNMFTIQVSNSIVVTNLAPTNCLLQLHGESCPHRSSIELSAKMAQSVKRLV